MRRRCNICEFVGEDFDFFKIKKKVCDACLKKINDDKQFKRKEKKEERKEYLKNWNLEHKEEKKEYNKKYYQENKENPEFKDRRNTYAKKYRENYPDRVRKCRYNNIKSRRQTDPLFKLTCNLRNLIKNSLTKQGYTKKSKTYEIIGIRFEDFKLYIESKFVEGMSWENYGEWHLDHIIPISSAKNEKELILLNKYTNFQPLWAIDNIRKSNSL